MDVCIPWPCRECGARATRSVETPEDYEPTGDRFIYLCDGCAREFGLD